MWEEGLVVASAGNVSRRIDDEHMAITPTSIAYGVLKPEDITIVHLATGRTVDSPHPPSYELPMHTAIYRARPDVAAIVHTHGPFVTTLSVLHMPLPPVIDEMMIYFGGIVEVSEYAFTGTADVGTNVVRALGDRSAALIANHGNVCVAKTLDRALHIAITMESCARVYVEALRVGEPVPLPEDAIRAGRKLYEERRQR